MKKTFLIFCFLMLTAMGPGSGNDKSGDRISPFEIDKLVGTAAPDFVLKNISGVAIPLSSFKGKAVLINFWATWCPPCKAEMPSLNTVYLEMRSRGFEVIAISVDKSADVVKDYLNDKNFGFLILMDEKREVFKKYKVFTLPTTFLIDKNGIIVEKYLGEYDWTSPEMKNKVQQLL